MTGDGRRRDDSRRSVTVVTFMLPEAESLRMNMSKIMAVLFSVLMVTSMIAWGALAAF